MPIKQILCFGDSNTWGFRPDNLCGGHARFDFSQRWPGRLQHLLGEGYRISEEGLNGRTTVFDVPDSSGRNSLCCIDILVQTHSPVDVAIVMLGSNDLKNFLHTTNEDIAHGLRTLCSHVLATSKEYGTVPKLLVVSPPAVLPGITGTWLNGHFDLSSAERSLTLFDAICKEIADLPVTLMDAKSITPPSSLDCLHLDAEGHAALAEALAAKIREILP